MSPETAHNPTTLGLLNELIDTFKPNTLPGHDQLAKEWQRDFYELCIREGGECNIGCCPKLRLSKEEKNNRLLVTPKGCGHFSNEVKDSSLRHGICADCIRFYIKYGARNLPNEHECADGKEEPHVCNITGDGLYTLIETLLEKKDFSFAKEETLIEWKASLSKLKKEWDELKKFDFLCKKCHLYKKLSTLQNERKYMKNYDVYKIAQTMGSTLCPACLSNIKLENTENCTVALCPSCIERGFLLKICCFCHSCNYGGKVVCPGSKGNDPSCNCPGGCLELLRAGEKRPIPTCTCEERIAKAVNLK